MFVFVYFYHYNHDLDDTVCHFISFIILVIIEHSFLLCLSVFKKEWGIFCTTTGLKTLFTQEQIDPGLFVLEVHLHSCSKPQTQNHSLIL